MRLTGALPGPPQSVLDAFDRRLDRAAAAPVTVAYSGGGDSLFLLLAAAVWAERCGRSLLALHVDHRLQPQSRQWANQARAVCAQIGAGFRLLLWSGQAPASGLPAVARAARLALLAQAAREAGARAVLLGHTGDDARESDVMRAEGGAFGRMGEWTPSPAWPEGRGLFHFRPLLGIRRGEIRERLRGAGWAWIEDPANEDLRYRRSRARAALCSSERQPSGGAPDSAGRCLPSARRQGDRNFNIRVDAAGVVTFARDALEGADNLPLAAALVCASGAARLPRSDRVGALRNRLKRGERFTATLSGARMEAGEEVTICRDGGEYRRVAAPRLELAAGRTGVWDGRFEIACRDERCSVVAVQGQAARLPKQQRTALRSIPAAARPTLPVLVNGAEGVTCPLLAEAPAARVRPLVATRLAAALGLIGTEADALAESHGADRVRVLCSGAE